MTDKEKFLKQKRDEEDALKRQAEYFESMAEVYLCELQDHLEPSKQIMRAMGVIVEMNSDLLKFLTKNPSTERSQAQSKRLEILMSVVDTFSVLSDRNYQIKTVLRSYLKIIKEKDHRIAELDQEILELKRSIDLHNS